MITILTIIATIIIFFDFFMITPFGFSRILRCLDEGKPCYEGLFVIFSSLPLVVILEFLKFISQNS